MVGDATSPHLGFGLDGDIVGHEHPTGTDDTSSSSCYRRSLHNSVAGWKSGKHQPANSRVVGAALEQLTSRRRIPKRPRYG